MKKNTKKVSEYAIKSFMENVNKCDRYVHTQTHSDIFGTVRLVKAAYENNGKRKFSVTKSPIIKSGSYTFAGLRKAFEAAI